MSDIVQQLVDDLKPRAPLRFSQFASQIGLVFGVLVIALLMTMGLRPDMGRHWFSIAKPAYYAAVCIVSLGALYRLSIPGSTLASWKYLSIAVGVFGVTILAYSFYALGLTGLHQAFALPHATECSLAVAGLGMLPLIWVLRWLKRAAPENPVAIGMLAGLASGTLAATVHALHCAQDHVFYMFIWNGLPIAGHMLIGGLVGGKILRW